MCNPERHSVVLKFHVSWLRLHINSQWKQIREVDHEVKTSQNDEISNGRKIVL